MVPGPLKQIAAKLPFLHLVDYPAHESRRLGIPASLTIEKLVRRFKTMFVVCRAWGYRECNENHGEAIREMLFGHEIRGTGREEYLGKEGCTRNGELCLCLC
jgi:hypothetical protein